MNTVMWSKLKEYILTKNSHGKNEILSKMVDLEIYDTNAGYKQNFPSCEHAWYVDSRHPLQFHCAKCNATKWKD